MTNKNWKKQKPIDNQIYVWENKDEEELSIKEVENERGSVYYVIFELYTLKYFAQKSQALKYAKDYMRKH